MLVCLVELCERRNSYQLKNNIFLSNTLLITDWFQLRNIRRTDHARCIDSAQSGRGQF